MTVELRDYSTLTGLAFVTRFATPSAIAAVSDEQIYDHLRGHGVRRPTIPEMISKARAAAQAQTVTLPGEPTKALLGAAVDGLPDGTHSPNR